MVDGINRFKRHVFLKQNSLVFETWIDDRYILARTMATRYNGPAQPGEMPRDRWVRIDTESGDYEVLPWKLAGAERSDLECFDIPSQRIMIRQTLHLAPERWDKRWLYGTFGQPLKEIRYDAAPGRDGKRPRSWSEEGRTVANCELVRGVFFRPREGIGWPDWYRGGGIVFYLRPGHGWLTTKWPSASKAGGRDVYLMKPDGRHISIPITAGEVLDRGARYVSYLDAYFVFPTLHFSDPHHMWTPHYVRLIYPEGKVEQFAVPELIMQRVRDRGRDGVQAAAQYTQRGILWYLSPSDRTNLGAENLEGNYLVLSGELVRIAQNGESVSPNGCKLFGYSERGRVQYLKPSDDDRFDYFFIDLCKEIQNGKPQLVARTKE
jgi:hypothetical protein